MAQYYAVVKIRGSKIPLTLRTYEAKDTMEAIDMMVKGAGVSGTSELDEFEMLEVVSAGYVPRASKAAKRERVGDKIVTTRTLPVTFPPEKPGPAEVVSTLPVPATPVVQAETKDTGYLVKEA